MKRYFAMMSIAILLIMTILPSVGVVASAEAAVKTYLDGEYEEFPVVILDAKEDKKSITDNYVDNTNLTVKGDNLTVSFDLLDEDMVQGIWIKENEEEFEVPFTEREGIKHISFEVDNLTEVLDGKIHVKVDMPLFVYDTVHDIRFSFDDSGIPLEEENNYEAIDYTVDVSAMERFIEGVWGIDGADEQQVVITFNTGKFIDNFQVDLGKGLENAVRGELVDGNVTYTFLVDSFDQTIPSKITIDAAGRIMVHEFLLTLGEGSQLLEEEGLANGLYNLPVEVLHADKDEVSSMDKYVEDFALLSVSDKSLTVELTFKDEKNMITNAQTELAGELVDLDFTTEDGVKIGTFTVLNLDDILKGSVEVDTGNPNFGKMAHDVRYKFGQPTVHVEKETEEEAEKEEGLADGDYTIKYNLLHESEDKVSTAASYLTNPAKLSVEKGKNIISLVVTDNEAIKDFKVEKNGELTNVKVIDSNETENTRTVKFEIDDLNGEYQASLRVFVKAANYTGDYNVRLRFDKNSIQAKEEEEEAETPVEPEEGKPEQAEEEAERPKQPELAGQKGKYLDGEYELPFNILQGDSNEDSTMNQFVNNIARIVIKDGVATVYMTIEQSDFITGFKTFFNGKLIDVVKGDLADGAADYSFKVENLDALLHGVITVNVPGVYENKAHDVRFEFNTEDLPLNPDYDLDLDFNHDEDLASGTDKDDSSKHLNPVVTKKKADSDNPKTGDTSNLLSLIMLLLGSGGLLFNQFRRRKKLTA